MYIYYASIHTEHCATAVFTDAETNGWEMADPIPQVSLKVSSWGNAEISRQ